MVTQRILIPVLLLSLLCYAVASYVMVGIIHADEHFQILEFANYKRGLLEAKHLPWEFEARLRPTIQPTLALIALETLDTLGLDDPNVQVFLLRLLSSIFFLFSSFVLFKSLETDFQSKWLKYLFLGATFFLYIFPIIGVRFSSENWCTCFFMLGFAQLHTSLKATPPKGLHARSMLSTGMLFGLSFLFRYQAAIMIFCLAVWLLVFHWRQFRYWLLLFAGFAFMILVGILIDRWFYGEWAITAWNYFNANLLEGVAASFGVEPWWWYFSKVDLSKWMKILNIGLISLLVVFVLTEIKNPIAWIFSLFLLVHCVISHKETRFLYPILVLIPYMALRAVETIYTLFGKKNKLLLLLVPFGIINGFAFVAALFSVSDNSFEIHKFIRTLPDKPLLFYYQGDNFYYALNSGEKDITPFFYKDGHRVTIQRWEKGFLQKLPDEEIRTDTLRYIIVGLGDQEEVEGKLTQVYDPEPGFVKKMNYRGWMRLGAGKWKVYSLNGEKPN